MNDSTCLKFHSSIPGRRRRRARLSSVKNGLYTIDAWRMFLSRLNPGGVLTVSRWYKPADRIDTDRLIAMANLALRRAGVTNPRRAHIALIANGPDAVLRQLPLAHYCLCTILVCRDPFSPQQLSRLRAACNDHGFQIVLDPDTLAQSIPNMPNWPNRRIFRPRR